MKVLSLLFVAFLSFAAYSAEPIYPGKLEKLKQLEMEVSYLAISNHSSSFNKSRSMEAALLYCYEPDEGTESQRICHEIGKTGSWKLKANPRRKVGYEPTSGKAKVTTDLATLKSLIAKYNPDGDLNHYLRVELKTTNWSTAVDGSNVEFDSAFFSPIYPTERWSYEPFTLEPAEGDWGIVGLSATFNVSAE